MSQFTDDADRHDLTEIFRVLGRPDPRADSRRAGRARAQRAAIWRAALGVTQSAVSHQLRLLRGARIVRPRRAGRSVFYALDDTHVLALYRAGPAPRARGSAGGRAMTAAPNRCLRGVRGPRRGGVPRRGPGLQRRGGHPGAPAEAAAGVETLSADVVSQRLRVSLRRRRAGPRGDGGCGGRRRPAHVARARGRRPTLGADVHPADVVDRGVGGGAGPAGLAATGRAWPACRPWPIWPAVAAGVVAPARRAVGRGAHAQPGHQRPDGARRRRRAGDRRMGRRRPASCSCSRSRSGSRRARCSAPAMRFAPCWIWRRARRWCAAAACDAAGAGGGGGARRDRARASRRPRADRRHRDRRAQRGGRVVAHRRVAAGGEGDRRGGVRRARSTATARWTCA